MKYLQARSTARLTPAILALVIIGCSSTNTQPTAQLPYNGSSSAALEEFESVTAARDSAISHADELALMDEASEISAIETESDSETIAVAANEFTDDEFTTAITTAPESINADTTDIWQRLRDGFDLPDKGHTRVNSDKLWYAKHQSYLNRTFERAEPYFYHIVDEVEARGMPLELALLPVVESAFQPFAYSHGRASGIWQFIPGTAQRFGLKIDWWYDGRRDITAATTAALDYLEALHKRFEGDWLLALAAYNSGEGTVARAIRDNERRGRGTTFWDLKLPRETEGYVPKLLAISAIVAAPNENGVALRPISNMPYVAQVDIGSQLDLAIAAELAGLSLEELYTLNPAFNRWATSPDGPHTLLLPLDKAAGFAEKLAQLPKDKRVKWVRHEIREGETLGHIASKYKTTVSTLQRSNKIRGNMIRAGQYLVIPTSSQSQNHYALSETQRLAATQNTQRSGNKIIHEVRTGDTFWDLSMAYKVSVRDIAAWNGMAPRDTLQLGQKLVIWTKQASSSAARFDAPMENPMAGALTQKINYRVRNGDSLARISQRFNVSVSSLKKWNPNARGKYIQPGQTLVVYVDVTRVSENI